MLTLEACDVALAAAGSRVTLVAGDPTEVTSSPLRVVTSSSLPLLEGPLLQRKQKGWPNMTLGQLKARKRRLTDLDVFL